MVGSTFLANKAEVYIQYIHAYICLVLKYHSTKKDMMRRKIGGGIIKKVP